MQSPAIAKYLPRCTSETSKVAPRIGEPKANSTSTSDATATDISPLPLRRILLTGLVLGAAESLSTPTATRPRTPTCTTRLKRAQTALQVQWQGTERVKHREFPPG